MPSMYETIDGDNAIVRRTNGEMVLCIELNIVICGKSYIKITLLIGLQFERFSFMILLFIDYCLRALSVNISLLTRLAIKIPT